MKNPTYVKLLKRAYRAIWDGKSSRILFPGTSEYICDHIEYRSNEEFRVAQELKRLISDRIDGHYGVDIWLISKGVPKSDLTPIRLQTYRKAWIKLLIKEFGGK